MKGGKSEALEDILENARQQFFKEYKLNANNKSTIFGIMQSLPEHSSTSHTPIEKNWSVGADKIQKILNDVGILIAQIHHTPDHLKKSVTSKTIRKILDGLQDNSIQITYLSNSFFLISGLQILF